MNLISPRFGPAVILAGLLFVYCASVALAHPMVENGLDVIIRPDRITIDARISLEQILVAAGWPATQPAAGAVAQWVRNHGSYVRNHLTVKVDGHIVAATSVEATNPQAMDTPVSSSIGSTMVPYRLEYSLRNPPRVIQIDQSFLREFNTWSASCILRIRQVDDAAFDTALLTRERTAEFDCVWPAATTRAVPENQSEMMQSKNANSPAMHSEPPNSTIASAIIHERVLLFTAAILLGGALCLFFFRRVLKNRS